MIDKNIDYSNKGFLKHLKGLGLSEKEIKYILDKIKRKKFEDGGGGDGGGSSGGDGDGSSGGDSSGDSGPGGSDDGSSSGVGSGEGDSTGDAGDQGGTEGPGGVGPGAEGGFGIGPGDDGPGMGVSDTFGSDTAPGVGLGVSDTFGSDVAEDTAVADVDMSMPAMQTVAEKAQAIAMSQMTPAAMAGRALGMMTGIPGMGIVGGMIGSNIGRGVTGPSDDTQEQSSVQSGPAQSVSDGGGGITTISNYAPLTNVSTGDNTADAMRTRLENLLKPVTPTPPISLSNVNSLSGYSLADLIRLRGR